MSDAAVPLPTTLAECHAKLLEQQTAIDEQQTVINTQQATIDEQQTMLEAMQRELALLKRMVFGQRRERFEDPRQGTLFDSLLIGDASEENESDESKQDEKPGDKDLPDADSPNEDTATSSRRKGRGRRVFPKCLPREERVRKLTDEEIPEDLRGTDFRRFRKKVSEWIDYRPPSMPTEHDGHRRVYRSRRC
jgi:Transposase C of IS166 homeodomain